MATIQNSIKDILQFTIGKNAVYGGLRFDEREANFEKQPILVLIPKILTIPFETMIKIATFNLNEKNKDVIINLLADYTCERVEQFIYQVSFYHYLFFF